MCSERLHRMLGESDTAVRKGVGATVPALLGGVASHVDDPGFASKLFDLVKSPANDSSVLNNIGSCSARTVHCRSWDSETSC